MTKICSKCGEEKPATTEYFRKAKTNKDGLRGQCKDCVKEYNKQYREENKEEIKELNKQWRKENKEEIKEYNKQYYKENKEEIKEKKNEYNKQYYEENKEKRNEYLKQYRQENKERVRQHCQTYRARKRLLPATLTTKQWQEIKKDFDSKCAYCGMTEENHLKIFNQQLHQEHFIPLSEGGEYTDNNIIPACRNCNSSKNNTNFFEWYPTYEEYNEEREQFILEYLGYIEDTQQLTLGVEMI